MANYSNNLKSLSNKLRNKVENYWKSENSIKTRDFISVDWCSFFGKQTNNRWSTIHSACNHWQTARKYVQLLHETRPFPLLRSVPLCVFVWKSAHLLEHAYYYPRHFAEHRWDHFSRSAVHINSFKGYLPANHQAGANGFLSFSLRYNNTTLWFCKLPLTSSSGIGVVCANGKKNFCLFIYFGVHNNLK